MQTLPTLFRLGLLLCCWDLPARAAEKPPLPSAHTTRNLIGWNVRVDNRLLTGEHAPEGDRALKLLEARLVSITHVVPEKRLSELKTVTIQLDLNHGDLALMQYHPDPTWLLAHGYSEKLAKCVHIPDVRDFLDPQGIQEQPWVVLHELAHALHDQFLGPNEPRITTAWKKFRDSGKYKSVRHVSGRVCAHYGTTNAGEFFAEMTESYFGSNDFFPFVAGELKQVEPQIFNLLALIWGPLPGSSATREASKNRNR